MGNYNGQRLVKIKEQIILQQIAILQLYLLLCKAAYSVKNVIINTVIIFPNSEYLIHFSINLDTQILVWNQEINLCV